MTLLELAERCEKADGPDRELDLAIKAAAYGGVALVSPFNGEWCLYRTGTTDPRAGKSFERPRHVSHETWTTDRYTASLDAAMTLVPEGWRIWTADFSVEGRFVWMLSGPKLTWVTLDDGSREGGEDWYQSGGAATPALALIAAALRARHG